jgi:putative methylase
MQKRIVRKLDLEMLLSRVKPHPTPSPNLEQYTISAGVAATMLHIAAYVNDDVIGKRVLDLGCGTGRLALGAAFLGANEVVGVDIDKTAVMMASENSREMGLRRRVQWVAADIDAVCGRFDTVLQNPPFGVQKRGADRKFLEKALDSGRAVYSLHKSVREMPQSARTKSDITNTPETMPSPFLARLVAAHDGEIEHVYAMEMSIPHMFTFHRKRRHEFAVGLYVIKKKGRRLGASRSP